MDVSVIIVNYNTKGITAACIESIFKYTRRVSFEVILVDNSSDDGSKEYFSSDNRITYIYNQENYGFGKANNVGAKVATGKYLFFLNSDTYLLNDAISLFYMHAETTDDGRIGFMGTVLIDDKGRPNGYGNSFPTLKNSLALAGHLACCRNTDYARQKPPFVVDYILGADVFTPKALFEQYGGFDEEFFMYYEESDLMKRASKDGYICQIIDGPRIVHLEAKSSGAISNAKRLMVEKSHMQYLKKHYSSNSFSLFLVAYILLRLSSFISGHFSFRENCQYMNLLISCIKG